MKIIKTSKGQEIYVDDGDFDWLSNFVWHVNADGYAFMNYGGKLRLQKSMHRMIFGQTEPGTFIDHRDRNTLNNTRNNLRQATRAENGRNRRKHKILTSKYRGVSLFKRDQIWMAYARMNGKGIYLGRFKIEEDAAIAYDKYAKEFYGEFASLNFKYCEDSEYSFRVVEFDYKSKSRTGIREIEKVQPMQIPDWNSLWCLRVPA